MLIKLIKKNKLLVSQILSIGITNQRETTVLWNKKTGRPINRAIVWQDRRTSAYCEKLKKNHKNHIMVYGSGNEARLTGLHETCSIDEFRYGVSDRGASIRIPVYTVEHNWNGYLEDRRPASNADPYKILAHIVGTLTK